MSARALLKAYRREHPIPLGPVRETKQYSLITDAEVLQWDYLWRDPASGRIEQLSVTQAVPPWAGPDEIEAAVGWARTLIRKVLETKCGDAHVPIVLALPAHCGTGRYV